MKTKVSSAQFKKLMAGADAARQRVSGYPSKKRAALRFSARDLMRGNARPT